MSHPPNATKPPETWSGNIQCPDCLFFVSAYAETELDLDMALMAAISTHVARNHPGKRAVVQSYPVDLKVAPKPVQ